MRWDAASRGPFIINARRKWQAQEHDRRVRLLGEYLTEDWEGVVDDFTDADNRVHKDKVLQLMEDAFKMGREENAADQRAGRAPADRGELEASVRPLRHEPGR